MRSLTTEQKSSRLLLAAHFTLWVLLSVVVCKQVLLPAFNAGPAFGISVQTAESDSKQRTMQILDFPNLLNFAKETVLHQTAAKLGTSAYSRKNHIQVTRNWVNNIIKETRYWADRDFAMPFAYSPTMLCLLAPFMLLPYNTAYCFFNVLGLLTVWWMTHPFRCRYGVGLLSFFSPIALGCFVLGQTALISGACLLFIAEKTNDENRVAGWNYSLPVGTALWMLTAKPPLAVTALAILLGLRRWRPLLVAGILTVLSTIMISPFLGPGWLSDYLQLISSYDLANISSVYSWSIRPDTMANLRAILSVDFGVPDDIASQASVIIWLSTIIYLAAGGGRRKYSDFAIWSLGILSYLIFCPHVTSTEELQILLLIPLCVSAQKRALSWQESAVLAAALFLPFASPAGGIFYGNRFILFAGKMLLLLFIIVCLKRRPGLGEEIMRKSAREAS